MQVLVHFWAHIVAISVVAHGFLPIGCTYMGFMLSLSLSLPLSFSLSLCRDDGSDSAADAYHNQLVAGDEEAPDDVP